MKFRNQYFQVEAKQLEAERQKWRIDYQSFGKARQKLRLVEVLTELDLMKEVDVDWVGEPLSGIEGQVDIRFKSDDATKILSSLARVIDKILKDNFVDKPTTLEGHY